MLIESGQLEQAAQDAFEPDLGAGRFLEAIALATDHFAQAFCSQYLNKPDPLKAADYIQRADAYLAEAQSISAALSHTRVRVKTPEGYAFYALYPEQYRDAARFWAAEHSTADLHNAIVLGIRSIGTSLSAVVSAELENAGWNVRRVCVRPAGHPFQRHVDLCSAGIDATQHALIVDEGPGLSGSSFVAVAKALTTAGIYPENITFLPGHCGAPGPAASDEVRHWWSRTPRLCVRLEDLRWSGHSLQEQLVAETLRLCDGNEVAGIDDLSGGAWRQAVFSDEKDWPAVCALFERLKYRVRLTSGAAVLWKFAGLVPREDGRSSAQATLEQLSARALRGWTPAPLGSTLGFVATQWIGGEIPTLDTALTSEIGRYIIEVSGPVLSKDEQQASTERLRSMLIVNAKEGLGSEYVEHATELSDSAERVLCRKPLPRFGDGRMAPFEWRMLAGRLVKLDAECHDSDHTIVGAQPLLWDVAGAGIEWQMPEAEQAQLASELVGVVGEVPPALMLFYKAAYAAFRFGQVSMCLSMRPHEDEARRLQSAANAYSTALRQCLQQAATAAKAFPCS
ncbi:MAG TPA: hypothetical protein VEK08_05910 [Planctomycetota bacterium]|nr:hypothetical protein [Planctomycetota bacterium]